MASYGLPVSSRNGGSDRPAPASREGEGTEERGSGSARDGKLCMRT